MKWIACLAAGLCCACGTVTQATPPDASVPDASPADAPRATIQLDVPAYLDQGASAGWQATIHGPPSASIDYTWQVTPIGAATLAPISASSALDASGQLQLSGTAVGGGSAATANAQLFVHGGAAGQAMAAIVVAAFETFGYRAPFSSSADTTLAAGRVLAVPLTMTAGQRVIAFGLRTSSAASVEVGLYGSSGSAPGDLLVASPRFATTPGENVIYLAAPQTPSGQPSYLAIVATTDVSLTVDAAAAHAVTEYAVDITSSGDLPSHFASTTSFMGGPTNVFVIAIAP